MPKWQFSGFMTVYATIEVEGIDYKDAYHKAEMGEDGYIIIETDKPGGFEMDDDNDDDTPLSDDINPSSEDIHA